MRKSFLGLFVFLISCSFCFSQTSDSTFIRKIADEILVNGKAYDNLHYLTKNIGGRLTASPQFYQAEKWGMQTLQQSGADKTWLQECMIPHWVRGGKDEAKIEGSNKSLDVIALGNSIGTGPAGVTADVIEANSFTDLDAKKDLVKGKIVFYNYKFNPTFVNTFQSYSDAVQYRGGGASRAAKYGAVAVIVRSMSHSTDNNPHTGSLRYDTTLPKIPAVAIGLKDADWLDSSLQKNSVSVSLKTNGYFLPDTVG